MRHLPPPSAPVTESNPRRAALKQISTAGLVGVGLCAPAVSHAELPFPWSALQNAAAGVADVMGLPVPAPAPATILKVQRAPMAVAMWDYSWLTRREGRQAEYLDFDAILDDFVMRGYNCLRIDAFPHLIAADDNGRRQDEFTMRGQATGFPWGNTLETTINPRRELLIFLSKCSARGIQVGLSTWLMNDKSDRALRIQSPAQLSRVWAETLDFIGQHGLLGVIEWVDLVNEFPSVQFMPGIVSYLNQNLSNKINQLSAFVLPFDQKQSSAISAYIYTAINKLKKQFPKLRFCVSTVGSGPADSFNLVDLSPMDLLEPHIWLNLNQSFGIPSGLDVFLWQGTSPLLPSYKIDTVEKLAQSAYHRRKASLLNWLGCAMDSWAMLGNKLNVPVYTTEAWAAINYYEVPDKDPNGANWAWMREVAQIGSGMAKARGWTGICSSNFCQPQFPSFYKDPAWHRQITGVIKGT